MNTQSFTQRAESPIINSAGQRPVEKKCRPNPSPNGAKSTGLRPAGALWRGLSPSPQGVALCRQLKAESLYPLAQGNALRTGNAGQTQALKGRYPG